VPTSVKRLVRAVLRPCTTGIIAGAAVAAALPGPGATAALSRAQAQAQAKTYLLVVSDMPAGWKAEGTVTTGGGSSTFPGARQLAGCIGVPARLITANAPEADSPDFQNPAGSLEVQDSVSVFPSATNARAEFHAIANSKTPRCMTTLVNAASFKSKILGSTGPGTTIGTITVARVSLGAYGTGSVGLTLTIPITAQGTLVTATLVEIFFIKGNLGHQISFNSYNTAFPLSLAKQLTSVAQSRL
jgi:hypothetical protein